MLLLHAPAQDLLHPARDHGHGRDAGPQEAPGGGSSSRGGRGRGGREVGHRHDGDADGDGRDRGHDPGREPPPKPKLLHQAHERDDQQLGDLVVSHGVEHQRQVERDDRRVGRQREQQQVKRGHADALGAGRGVKGEGRGGAGEVVEGAEGRRWKLRSFFVWWFPGGGRGGKRVEFSFPVVSHSFLSPFSTGKKKKAVTG